MSGIPVVDLAPLNRPATASARGTIETIGDACRTWGFFQVVNHGVPDELIGRVWTQTRAFFALPRHSKLAILRSRDNPRGYYDRELTKNRRDLKEVFDFGAVPEPHVPDDHPCNRATVDGANRWPSTLPSFRATMLEYFAACELLGLRLLETFCVTLGVQADALQAFFVDEHSGFARLNYYPLDDPLDQESGSATTALGDMALHHHTDAGVLTILLQDDVGGLQVRARGEWVGVVPLAGALVINVGDMMQVWSNDRFRAALHRVRPIEGRPRYSIPFFFNPSYDTDCVPLMGVNAGPPKYRTVNWGAFRQARTDGDYADYGKEIQIEDFRI